MKTAKKYTLALLTATILTGSAVSAPKIPADSASSPTNRATVAITIPAAAAAQVYCAVGKMLSGTTCVDIGSAVKDAATPICPTGQILSGSSCVVIPNQSVPSGSFCGSLMLDLDSANYKRGNPLDGTKCNGNTLRKTVTTPTWIPPYIDYVSDPNPLCGDSCGGSYVYGGGVYMDVTTLEWNCPVGYTVQIIAFNTDDGTGSNYYSCLKD